MTDVESEIRAAAHLLRNGQWDGPDHLRGPLAALLDQAADISRGLDRDPYPGLWQGRALAIARAITKETPR